MDLWAYGFCKLLYVIVCAAYRLIYKVYLLLCAVSTYEIGLMIDLKVTTQCASYIPLSNGCLFYGIITALGGRPHTTRGVANPRRVWRALGRTGLLTLRCVDPRLGEQLGTLATAIWCLACNKAPEEHQNTDNLSVSTPYLFFWLFLARELQGLSSRRFCADRCFAVATFPGFPKVSTCCHLDE